MKDKMTLFAGIMLVASLVFLGYNFMNYQKEQQIVAKAQTEYLTIVKEQQKKQTELNKAKLELKDKEDAKKNAEADLKAAKEEYQALTNHQDSYTSQMKPEVDFFVSKTIPEHEAFTKDYEEKQKKEEASHREQEQFTGNPGTLELAERAVENTEQGPNGLSKAEAESVASHYAEMIYEGGAPFRQLVSIHVSFIKNGKPYADGSWPEEWTKKNGEVLKRGTKAYDILMGSNFSGEVNDAPYGDAK